MTESDLIKIEKRVVHFDLIDTVDAKELHLFLESKQHFSDWIKARIDDFGFVQGVDYIDHTRMTQYNQVDRIDYFLTVDMAKELSMVERNDKGKKARQYFISMEKKALQNAPKLPSNYKEAVQALLVEIEEKEKLQGELTEAQPKIEFHDQVGDATGLYTIGETASQEEIKQAWRSKSRESHPDKFSNHTEKQNAEECQKEINQAYTVLKDPNRRNSYDKTGSDAEMMTVDDIIKTVFSELIRGDFYDEDRIFAQAQDAIEKVIQKFEFELNSAESQIVRCESKISELKEILKNKVKSKDHNILRDVINEEIMLHEQVKRGINVDPIKYHIEIHKEAFRMIKDLYPKEPEKERNSNNWQEILKDDLQQHNVQGFRQWSNF